ncbi:hypothetical protein PRIPAC_80459 [Pristionchus pacificus]|uniref:Uncharacterized protein n=1 Tax=Pristionchus pacificus TaxID=54126 RepID=A0A2A6BXZ3_PRIPA|nr:hypothetical protein PRIPAC_80459 [Pristionchus pacificus]|eukprot:PDM70780.1 hypothetical protein PRIPAC_44984 [Pristionchus pacificus]
MSGNYVIPGSSRQLSGSLGQQRHRGGATVMPIARRRPVGQARRDEEEEEDEEESMRGGRHIDKNVRGVMKRRKREKRTHGIKELEWNWSGIGRERERANYWKHLTRLLHQLRPLLCCVACGARPNEGTVAMKKMKKKTPVRSKRGEEEEGPFEQQPEGGQAPNGHCRNHDGTRNENQKRRYPKGTKTVRVRGT